MNTRAEIVQAFEDYRRTEFGALAGTTRTTAMPAMRSTPACRRKIRPDTPHISNRVARL